MKMYIIPGMDGVGLTNLVSREDSRDSLYSLETIYSISASLILV